MLRFLVSLLLMFVFSCSKKSDSGGLVTGEVATTPEEIIPASPSLIPIANQTIFQWVENTNVFNANDLSGSDLTSTGSAISYDCFLDQTVDGAVDESTTCASLTGLNFDSTTGVLAGTLSADLGGVHEIMIKATADGLSDTTFFTLTVHTLNSLTVTLNSSEIRIGGTATASAIGIYSNGWLRPMTSLVSWSSSQTSVATNTGPSLSALALGNTLITADFNALSAAANLNVKSATLSSLQINQLNPTIPLNGSLAFKATGYYDDGSSEDVTQLGSWSSANLAVATIATASGVASAVSAGTSLISIDYGGLSHQRTLTVTSFSVDSIAITPMNPSGIIGLGTQLYATAFLSNGTTQDVSSSVEWLSATPAVATVNAQGRVSSLSTGTTLITAQLGGLSAQANFTVSNLTISSLAISSLGTSLSVGFQQTAKAMATLSNGGTLDVSEDVLWSSLNPALLSVQNTTPKGRVTALSAGSTSIRVQLASLQATQTVTVTTATLSSIDLSPSSTFLWQGEVKPLRAIGVFSDASTLDITSQVTWSSSDASRIVMSNIPDSKGLAQVVYVGAVTQNVTITATLGAVSRSMNAIINPATLNSLQINTSALTLQPNSLYEFKVFGHYSDGGSVDLTKSATWSSTDEEVAFISNALNDKGALYSEDLGSTSIRAQVGAIQSNIVNVTVSDVDPVVVEEQGTGLRASYFTGRNFDILRGIRIDSSINYNWGTGQAPLGVGDSFSIRWEGQLKSPVTASCRLHSYSDDGFRVFLNNTLVLNDWSDHAPRWANSNWINFTQNQLYDLRVEFYENGGHAVAQLHWECTGHFALTLVQRELLFPALIQ